MKRIIFVGFVIAILGPGIAATGSTQNHGAAPAPPLAASHTTPGVELADEAQTALVKQDRAGCHSDRVKSGGLTLAHFDAAAIAQNAEVAEKMVRKLRAGMMPPPQAKRPDAQTVSRVRRLSRNEARRGGAAHPNPGWRPFQRLNRAEYAAAIRGPPRHRRRCERVSASRHDERRVRQRRGRAELLAAADGRLPARREPDQPPRSRRSHGGSARRRPTRSPRTARRCATSTARRWARAAAFPSSHVFPADGDYVIKTSLHYEALGGLYGRYSTLTMGIKEQVEVSINGERVALLEVEPDDDGDGLRPEQRPRRHGARTPPIHIKAGPQRVTAAFVQRLDGPVDDLLAPIENTLRRRRDRAGTARRRCRTCAT